MRPPGAQAQEADTRGAVATGVGRHSRPPPARWPLGPQLCSSGGGETRGTFPGVLEGQQPPPPARGLVSARGQSSFNAPVHTALTHSRSE